MTYDLDRLHADLEEARATYQYLGAMNVAIRPGFTAQDARRLRERYDESLHRLSELEGARDVAAWGIQFNATPEYRERVKRTLAAYREEKG